MRIGAAATRASPVSVQPQYGLEPFACRIFIRELIRELSKRYALSLMPSKCIVDHMVWFDTGSQLPAKYGIKNQFVNPSI